VLRSFDRNVTGIGVLADSVRRRLYRFVCSQDQPVSRDQAAEAVGVARHKAKFHLDRLEAEGLLEADYVRLTGRTGPGAGRPAKRYRQGTKEFAITLPARDYELAARVMADAIAESARTGASISEVVDQTAAVYGAAIAATARDHPSSVDAALDIVVRVLSEHAYEPRRTENTVTLANCPFKALAADHTDLICQLNRSLLAGFADSLAPDLLQASLEHGENRCCVMVTGIFDDQQSQSTEVSGRSQVS
jgi:predicted ArsR family transcriptional regulator